jgi:predicted membrane protein DUF2207
MRAALFLLLLIARPALGAERVLDFHSDIRVARNGDLSVTERIAVQAEGDQIQRGILRDFPTDYQDRFGNKVKVPLDVITVTRDGKPERFALERLANGTRIRIGRAEQLLPHGPHVYEIVYRTARQVGFFDKHDELYWNVNGNGWTLPFERISAEVRLPGPVRPGELKLVAYTGPQGERGGNYDALAFEGAAGFRSTRRFAPREGMTIVVGFPKGVVVAPTFGERTGWFLHDNRGLLAGAGGYLVLLGFLFGGWWLVGRGPRPGPAFPRYKPPAGLGPAGVRYIDRKGYDDRCFAAALLGLGSRGALKIRGGSNYEIEPTGKRVKLHPGEEVLAKGLSGSFHFDGTHDPRVQDLRERFSAALKRRFGRQYYAWNHGPAFLAVLIGAGGVALMVGLQAPGWSVAATVAAMAATVLLFAHTLLPAYSVPGRKLQDEIDGLRQYLSVAEADDLARMKAPPPQTKEEFSRFLPYALALDVEKTWADRFAQVLGAAAVAAAVADYFSSTSDSDRSFESLTSSLSDLGDTISSASTPPGSSSG